MKRRIATVLGGILAAGLLSMPTAAAEDPPDRPDFKAPFSCDQTWAMFTYGGHGPDDGSQEQKRIDMQWTEGETEGAAIVASAGGTVSHVEPGGVHIDHGNGWFTQYLHMKDRVPEGTEVGQGDRIGAASNVGTGVVHLHYQQMYDFDGNGYPTEGNQGPAELVYPVIQGKEYRLTPENGENLKSTNCDGDGGEPEPEPEPEDTTLAYTGDKSIANGSEATLSAELRTKDSDEPVEGREVSFELGSEDGGGAVQTCDGETDADGTASCTVEVADQKLTDDGTVPLTATFAGDDAYVKSKAEADLKLQHMEGRSYGLAAEVPLPLLPLSIDPTPDTGTLRTAEAESLGPECAEGVNAVVLNADALCAEVAAKVGPSAVTSTATVADVSIGLPGLPVVGVSGLTSKSTSSCEASTGSVELELTVAGTPVEIPDTPGFEVDLGLAGKLVVNEQIPVDGADKGLTVNAVHLTTLAGADVVIGSSTSSAHDCA
ncbi:choice-of-anchor P family protein [Streptomyces sp. B-S-A8]|uniref:Choice-of-anchor P family protein n=1 Tax=Streptomyces solicavernae TaxID=3043614 RepID=A0ABT6RQP5_9ACTN|nr:choice-of-anchor P family protein [Streptomyces sp. B-S-A8]MDI3386078.1 choice-of-anchor P family protein [Streptomyces sp. B-S-A8]